MTVNYNFQTLRIVNSRFEAEIIKSKLESYKIQSIIQADDLGGLKPFPFQPNSNGVKILVLATDIDKAQNILQLEAAE